MSGRLPIHPKASGTTDTGSSKVKVLEFGGEERWDYHVGLHICLKGKEPQVWPCREDNGQRRRWRKVGEAAGGGTPPSDLMDPVRPARFSDSVSYESKAQQTSVK
ncbi:hypothetical protein EYF80_031862 [Liparis tanakae]|uniref:Uncharacterized protein n=1 Tax=Liparis tanakae TaxID=230148 RepID=A0A4Z2GWP8_9TELE|nr:hypothetical protein EYF80_031862 [Liparis tanakae]